MNMMLIKLPQIMVKQQAGELFLNAKNGWYAMKKLLLGGLWNVRIYVFLNYVGSNFFKVGGKWDRFVYNIGMIQHKILVKGKKLSRQAAVPYFCTQMYSIKQLGKPLLTHVCNIQECDHTAFQFDGNYMKLLWL